MSDLPVVSRALPVLNEEGLSYLREIVQRMRRMETKMTTLCIQAGIPEPLTKQQRVTVIAKDPTFVELSGLDVSISDVLTGVKGAGIVTGIVTMLHKGALVGSIDVSLRQLQQGVDNGSNEASTD